MTDGEIGEADVRAFMERVRASGVLGRAMRRDALLEHLLLSEVNGEGDRLKGYSIGLDVLGKGEDFDPSQDSIVRVEMARLRDALLLFEAGTHATGVIEVEIPRGTYRPTLRARRPPPSPAPPPAPTVAAGDATAPTPRTADRPDPRTAPRQTASPTASQTASPSARPPLRRRLRLLLRLRRATRRARRRTVLVAAGVATVGVAVWVATHPDPPMRVGIALDVTRDTQPLSPDDARIVGQYVLKLRSALARNEAIRVVDDLDTPTEGYTVRPALIGLDRSRTLAVELLANDSSRLLWAQASDLEPGDLDTSLDAAVTDAVRGLTPQLISSTKRDLEARDPDTLNAWELYLLSTWSPGAAVSTLAWEVQRRDYALRAVALDPTLGQAHSVLADKLVYLSGIDSDHHSEAAVDLSSLHAQEALARASQDANVLFNLGVHAWHLGDLALSTRYMQRVLEIDRENGLARLLAVVTPYTCRPPPDSILAVAQAFDAGLSPENPMRWVTLTWLGMLHLNRGGLAAAEKAEALAATIFRTPDTAMRHAAILQAMGRTEQAAELLDGMRGDWPNLSAAHFANVTMPRRCHEDRFAEPLLDRYRNLAKVLN